MFEMKPKVPGYIYEQHYVWGTRYKTIFITSYHKPVFNTKEKKQQLDKMIKQIANVNDSIINDIKIEPDYVIIEFMLKPRYSVADKIKSFKGGLARNWFKAYPKLRDQMWKGHLWDHNYLVGTIGSLSKEDESTYIENRKGQDFEQKLRDGDGRTS